MKLNELVNVPGSYKKRKRVGRGIGSGKGKTCGKGEKGQKARSGVAIKTEGGQMPLIKRLPKRGFNCNKSVNYSIIDLYDLMTLVAEKKIAVDKVIDKKVLAEINFIKNANVLVKLLGNMAIKEKIRVELDSCSAAAKSALEKAGGEFVQCS